MHRPPAKHDTRPVTGPTRWCRTVQQAGHGLAINIPAPFAAAIGAKAGSLYVLERVGPDTLRFVPLHEPVPPPSPPADPAGPH